MSTCNSTVFRNPTCLISMKPDLHFRLFWNLDMFNLQQIRHLEMSWFLISSFHSCPVSCPDFKKKRDLWFSKKMAWFSNKKCKSCSVVLCTRAIFLSPALSSSDRSLPLIFVDNSPNMHNTIFFPVCLLLSVTNESIWISPQILGDTWKSGNLLPKPNFDAEICNARALFNGTSVPKGEALPLRCVP